MTSQDDKPVHKQFLRVQREDEEDTWISGEELKTEGSSGSDDDVPRRKVTTRKSRRRRSEGYTPPESRLSLPNLCDNKAGIAFRVSKPDEKDFKGDRFSVGGNPSTEDERIRVEAAISRMSTRSSLDKMEEENFFSGSENEWRPKRGSLKLPNLEEETQKKRVIRFSDEVEKIDDSYAMRNRIKFNGFDFDVYSDVEEGVEHGDEDYEKCRESTYENNFDEYDIDRYVAKCSNVENWKPVFKNKFTLPNFDTNEVDYSAKELVYEMDDFYNQMSSKLKSLKNCTALKNSNASLSNIGFENFAKKENFKDLHDNLNKTPQMKKTLSLINKMDSDISETITEFRKARQERFDIQKQMLNGISKDRNSQFFLQMCEFELKTNDNKTDNSRKKTNKTKNRVGGHQHDKNFIERNIELAKIGMNFSLSDEQKERLEKMLKEEVNEMSSDGDNCILPVVKDKNMSSTDEYNNEVYSECRVNAFNFEKEQRDRLVEIDEALQDFKKEFPRKSSETYTSEILIRSLKEIDEKLKALSESYLHDEERLQRKHNSIEMDSDRMEPEDVVEINEK